MRLGMGLGLGNLLSGGPITGMSNKYSFNFDGSNDYLEVLNNSGLQITGAITISAWIKYSSAHSGGIVSKGSYNSDGAWGLALATGNDRLQFALGNGEDGNSVENVYSSDISMAGNGWVHVAAVHETSANTVIFYKNGSLLNSASASSITMGKASNNVLIGATNDSETATTAGDRFNGDIDEVAVWSVALSANDIAKIASKPSDLSKASSYDTDRTSNLKLWLRAGDKILPEEDASIARSDFYTDFDGSNDYVNCGDGSGLGFSGDDPLTITAWINPSTVDTAKVITGFGSDASSSYAGKRVALYLSSQKPYFAFWSTDVYHNGNVIEANKWQHLAITYKGGNTTTANSAIYLDGESLALSGGTASALDLSDMDWLRIGADHVPDQEFAGKIANTSIYKTALDAQTIKQFAKSRFTPMRDNRFSVVDFDGTNDYIDTDADSTRADATYTFWAKSDKTTSNHSAFGHGGERLGSFHFNYNNTNPLLHMGGTRYRYWADSSAQDDNAWHHWAVVLDADDATACKLYIDGIEQTVAGTANSGDYDTYTTGLCIGSDGGTAEWEGSMAQFAVYSDLKDADFIYAQYAKGITGDYSSDSNLQGYWRMGDDTSKAYPTIADSSSNSNDGTITNGASDDIVQQMVAGWDMGAFESDSEELGVEKITLLSNWTGSDYTSTITASTNTINLEADVSSVSASKYLSGSGGIVTGTTNLSVGFYKISFDASWTNAPNIKQFKWYSDGSTVTTETIESGSNVFYKTTTTANGNSHFNIQMNNANQGITLANLSISEVLQSEVSDTYPAIIDVNEPVLGAELVTNGTFDSNVSSWASQSGVTASYDSGSMKITADSGGSGAYVSQGISLTANKLYKISLDVTQNSATNVGNLKIGNAIGSTNGVTPVVNPYFTDTESGLAYYFTPSATATHYISFRTSVNSDYFNVDNVSLKEIQGNVGTMTNQAADDLVYSSVLPDQSFLTGVNSAYNFIDLDGSNEYIACGDILDIGTSNFSFSFWANQDSQATAYIIDKRGGSGAGYQIAYDGTSGVISTHFNDGGSNAFGLDGGTDVSDTNWHHIVVVIDRSSSTNCKIYVNGSDDTDSRGTIFTASISNSEDLNIGRRNDNSNYFNGKIGQVAFYNKALSATEVGAIYTLGRHGNLLDSYADNLLLYLGMGALDASTGLSDVGNGTIYDRSGQSNHGTATNTEAADLASSPNADPNGYAKGDTNRSTDVK